MKLYYYPGACSLAPHIVVRELGLECDLVKVDLATKRTESGDCFANVNPKGYVPALALDNGIVLTETPAMLQYLADLRTGSKLAPAPDVFDRVILQENLNFVTAELHKPMGSLFKPGLPDTYRAVALDALRPRLDYLDGQLAGREYLMRSGFTVADAYAFAILNWSDMLDIDLAAWPAIVAYKARIAARTAVRDALAYEGLSGDG